MREELALVDQNQSLARDLKRLADQDRRLMREKLTLVNQNQRLVRDLKRLMKAIVFLVDQIKRSIDEVRSLSGD